MLWNWDSQSSFSIRKKEKADLRHPPKRMLQAKGLEKMFFGSSMIDNHIFSFGPVNDSSFNRD